MAAKKSIMKKLTSLQKRFCDIILLMELSGKVNQAKAYQLAGSKSRGKNLIELASRTTRLVQCQAYLARARERRAKVVEKTEAEIIAQYERLGFSELTDFASWDSKGFKLKPSKDIPKDKIPALKSITIEEREYKNKKGRKGTIRRIHIELHGQKGALDSLAKIKGMMKPDIGDAVTFAVALHEAMKDES